MSSVTNSDRLQPLAQWEDVDVVFGPTPTDVDLVVQHTLSPPTPEHVNYQIIRAGQAVVVYHNTSGTRKPWADGYILLRATAANAKVTLRLSVNHSQRTLPF